MPDADKNIFRVWAKWRNIPCWLRHLYTLGYPQVDLDVLEYIDDQFYLFVDEEEQAWRNWQRKNLPRIENEWVTIFPEARKIIPIKIREWRMREQESFATLKRKLEKLRTLHGLDAVFYREWLKLTDASEIAEVRRHLRRLHFAIAPPKASLKRITQADIETAKSVSIQDLLPQNRFIRSGSQLKTLCPFHQEKTPSFYVRPHRNTFHCFGCDKSGSSIDLIMLIYGSGFVDAVKRLVHSNSP